MMHDEFKRLIANQYEASLCTVEHCVERCPDACWNVRIAKYPFSQVAFHTLFFADYYLSQNSTAFRQQPLHEENQELFADYEQLHDQEPRAVYSRQQIQRYGQFCRSKALVVIAEETENSLCAAANFERRNFSRAELHVYNIRHIQHHAAQLILRLRIDTNVDVPWIGSGWVPPTSE